MATRIKNLNKELEQISRAKDRYGLARYKGGRSGERDNTYRETSSLMESDIIGRDGHLERAVETLVDVNLDADAGKVSVVSFVGMGGVGKTALAQKVYNDKRVKEHFKPQMWVFVPKNPTKSWIAARVLEEIAHDGGRVSEVTGLNAVHMMIGTQLSNQRFLLVLDDVQELGWWASLKAVLDTGAPGSKILVTTRNEQVSDEIRAVSMHKLECLSEGESWKLFLQYGSRAEDTEADLENLGGREIIKRCAGLPLALKTIGGVMRNKDRRKDHWDAVLKNRVWDWKVPSSAAENKQGLLPALMLSYENLETHLRSCFSFCSVFPKGCSIPKNYLTRLWIAEAFIPEGQGDLEVTADEYVKELIQRCLFHHVKLDPSNGDIVSFRMHDIVHDLALYTEGNRRNSTNVQARRISFPGEGFSVNAARQENVSVRTLLWPGAGDVPKNLFSIFKRLRVLDLSNHSINLPDSIKDLVLLRYLKLSGADIKVLPNAIGELKNLQIIDLRESKIQMLPREIQKLCQLRHLDLENTSSLKHMPPGVGALTGLRTLNKFVVGGSSFYEEGCSIRELKNMNQLKGSLSIENLANVETGEVLAAALLHKKTGITSLTLSFYSLGSIAQERTTLPAGTWKEAIENAFEELQLPTNLTSLTVREYLGRRSLRWFNTLQNYDGLREINLLGLRRLERLPPLGILPKLKRLRIEEAHAVIEVTDEFYGPNKEGGFPELEELIFDSMKGWEEWRVTAPDLRMRRLQKLTLSNCPCLKDFPLIVSLEDLNIEGCNVLGLPGMKTSRSRNVPDLSPSDISELRSGGQSTLSEHADLSKFSAMRNLSSLTLKGFHGLEWLPHMVSLQYLMVERCGWLSTLPYMPSLQILTLKGCFQSLCILRGPSVTALYIEFVDPCLSHSSLEPHFTGLAPRCRGSISLKDMPLLQEVKLDNCKELELEGLDLAVFLLPNMRGLASLRIRQCTSIRELSDIPALKSLEINDCEGIEEVSAMRALESLRMSNCGGIKYLANMPTLKSINIT